MKAVIISFCLLFLFGCKKENIEVAKAINKQHFVQVICQKTEWYYQIKNTRHFFNANVRENEIVKNMGNCESVKQSLPLSISDSITFVVMPVNETVVLNLYENDSIVFTIQTNKYSKIKWQF